MTFRLNKNGGRDRILNATYSPKLFRKNLDLSDSSNKSPKVVWIFFLLVGLVLTILYLRLEKGSPVALPDNGGEVRYENSKWMSQPLAPFKIVADPKAPTIHYWITAIDSETSEPVLSIFVIGGREAQTLLPIGEYRVQISEGTTWYGVTHAFGRRTITNDLKQPIKLYQISSSQLVGVTLNLSSQVAQSFAGRPSSKP